MNAVNILVLETLKKEDPSYYLKLFFSRHFKTIKLKLLFNTIHEGQAYLGRFLALIDIVVDSENYILDLTSVDNIYLYANELNLTRKDFIKFIELLKSNEIKLLTEVSENKFTIDELQELFANKNDRIN